MGARDSDLENELCAQLKICCGETSAALEPIRQTLSIMKRRWGTILRPPIDDGTADQTYVEQDVLLGYTTNVGLYYVFLHYLDDLGLIEHGVGVRCAWPTEAGLDVLTKLEAWRAEQELGASA